MTPRPRQSAPPSAEPARGLTLDRQERRRLQRAAQQTKPAKSQRTQPSKLTRFGWNVRGGGYNPVIDVVPEWRGTSVQVCGLWPFAAGSGSPLIGVPIGKHLLNGCTVCADPITWFLSRLINNPSAFILGRPGLGKSSLTRRIVLGLAYQGIVPLVMSDLKPDYVDEMTALGGDVIRVGRGVGSINPLDPGPAVDLLPQMDEHTRSKTLAELRSRQHSVVTSLIELVRMAPLGPREKSLLTVAIRLTEERHAPRVPLLGDLLDTLQQGHPALRAVALDRGDDERYRDAIEGLVEGLMALGPDGPFGHVFSEPTTKQIRIGVPTCIDVSSIPDGDTQLQAAAQAVCWSYGSAAVSAATAAADAGIIAPITYFLVMDELWRILRASDSMIDLIDAITRLNRQKGLGQVMITHTMADLRMSSEALTHRAWGFVERSAMVFIGGLADKEMGNLREVFALSNRETQMIQSWSVEASVDPRTNRASAPPGQGCFLLKLGKAPGIPFVTELTPTELTINDTNKRWAELAQQAAAPAPSDDVAVR